VQQLRADPAASADEHVQIVLVQTEVERVRFIVRSYVPTRLDKVRPLPPPPRAPRLTARRQIERFAQHILARPDMQRRLSAIELRHAQA